MVQRSQGSSRPWIAYVRVSDEDQVKGLSIDAQRDACIAFMAARGVTDCEVVSDPGFSAFRDDAIRRRPGMRGILARVERGEIAGIIAWKADRIARSLYDTLTLAKLLREHGAALVAVTEAIDSSGPNGPFLMQLHAMLAEKSSEDTSLRVKASFAKKIERGEWLGGPIPAGCVITGGEGRRRLERDPVTGPIVGPIWSMVARGSTLSQIGDHLRHNGVRPYNGSRRRPEEAQARAPRTWTRQAVLNLLRCKSLVGVLVDQQTRDLALAALATRFAPGRAGRAGVVAAARPSIRIWRLANLARCAACGATLVGLHAHAKGKTYPYLRCSNRAKSRELCSASDLPAVVWEDAVVRAVSAAVAGNGAIVKALTTDLEQRQCRLPLLADRRSDLIRTQDTIRARIGRLAVLVADGGAAADAVKPTLANLQAELVETERLTAVVEGELGAARMTLAELEEQIATVRANVQGLEARSHADQHAALRTLVAEVRLGIDHPIGLTLWWDDRGFVQASRVAPRGERSTNHATIAVSMPVKLTRRSSERGGWSWHVELVASPTSPTGPRG